MSSYKQIARAIYKKAERNGSDARNLIRTWCMLFEETRVTGWSRDAFLLVCVDEKIKIQERIIKRLNNRK